VPKLVRITTVPISLKFLITGQMCFMKNKGFDVVMMSADGEEIEEVQKVEGCPHKIIPLTRKITPAADLKALWILYKELRKIKPDIVHTHTPKAGLIGMMASWLARVPLRLHTVAGLPLESTTGLKRKLLLFIEWLTYKCSTEVWPNSNSLYEFIETNSLASSNKLHVIGKGSSNGIDVSEFHRDTLTKEILENVKRSISFDAKFTYFLFVGRIVKDKGIEELVRAFENLQSSFNDIKLILVGPLESDLDPLSPGSTESIESNPSIISTGFSSNVKYFMHLCDYFVFPSHREGFPNVPMQAALMNCPVIASRINGNVDIVDHEVNGLLHEKGNKQELQEKMLYALQHPLIMKEQSERLKEKITDNYDRKVIHELIFERYKGKLDQINKQN